MHVHLSCFLCLHAGDSATSVLEARLKIIVQFPVRIRPAPLTCSHGVLTLTEITDRIRDTLMQNMSLLEVLSWTRKTILKPPDWNLPDQPDLFGGFFC